MNIFDYAKSDIEEYKEEKSKLVSFLEVEILIPCMENRFIYEKTLSKTGHDNYAIYLDKKSFWSKREKIVDFEISGMRGCINGSRYILECIKDCSVKCSIYSGEGCFTDYNKENFKKGIGIIFRKFMQ